MNFIFLVALSPGIELMRKLGLPKLVITYAKLSEYHRVKDLGPMHKYLGLEIVAKDNVFYVRRA